MKKRDHSGGRTKRSQKVSSELLHSSPSQEEHRGELVLVLGLRSRENVSKILLPFLAVGERKALLNLSKSDYCNVITLLDKLVVFSPVKERNTVHYICKLNFIACLS
jgi:hypothetical protein